MSCFDDMIAAQFADVRFTRDNLHFYQFEEAVPFLYENPFSALFIDMGLGKTISSLTVIVDLLSDFDTDDPVLVVGPLRVATETWPTEIASWEHTAPFTYSLIHAMDDDPRLKDARDRARAYGRTEGLSTADINKMIGRAETAEGERIRRDAAVSRKPIHIISRDWLEWLCNFWKGKWPYRTVIIDESSSFKDHNSARFNAIKKIRNTDGLITRMHLLTATPAAESYEHLFPQIWLLDRGERLGKNITSYRKEYFDYNQYSRKYTLRSGSEEKILELISDICLVMKVEDYLDLEKPVIVPRPVHLSEQQMALYKEMETEFVVTLPDGTEVEAETAAALSQKLLQMASGVLYETYFDVDVDTDDMKKVKRIHHLHDHKIDMLKQIVEESQGEPILVGYHHKASLDRLKKAFPKAVVMDKEGKVIKKWNARKIPMLLMHPQSGGHGLNLQQGGHNIVFFDLPWSLELYLQFIGRLARQGQTAVVVVQLLISSGTLDEFVWQCLSDKEDAQDRLFSILKRLIRRHRSQKSLQNAA
jgi:SNF2 family DNA or RNA helicase